MPQEGKREKSNRLGSQEKECLLCFSKWLCHIKLMLAVKWPSQLQPMCHKCSNALASYFSCLVIVSINSMGHLCNVLIQKSPRGSINVSRLIKHKSLNVKTDTFILSRLQLYRFLFNEKEKKRLLFLLTVKCL